MKHLHVAITSGDHDGIGTEVVTKALRQLGPQKGVQFYLWRSPACPKEDLRRVDAKFNRVVVTGWPEALKERADRPKTLIDINSPMPPAKWVETAANAALFGKIDAIATGPLSKTSIVESGFRELGHTEILQKVSKVPRVHMAFLGNQFNVLLATGHKPLKEVSKELSPDVIDSALRQALELRTRLPRGLRSKPIALLGLNPHAGEKNLIGDEESRILTPTVALFRQAGHPVEGPLVPDAAFLPHEVKNYSVFVCCYHDQGLIPFKMAHGPKGVHLSMGLPFVRTSVDHGTAKDLFGRNKADPASMVEAIRWAIKLAQNRKNPS